nr:putative integron gene cassette protein [uncultured bacterium]
MMIALCELLNPETECRRSSRHGVCGEDQKPWRGKEEQVPTSLDAC